MKYNEELDINDRNSLSVLLQRIRASSTVLEFGPANGRMSKYLKEHLGCRVYAVEIDADAAVNAQAYTEQMVIENIEAYGWVKAYAHMRFDHIIFADVLEHLYDPESVLKRAKEFLNDEGGILISIPNIAHNAIIMELIDNEFRYSDRGLLDDTHIRFFTKQSFDRLLIRCGLYPHYESAIYVNPEKTEFTRSYYDHPIAVGEYLRGLDHGEAYQLLYEVKPHRCDTLLPHKNDENTRYHIQLFFNNGEGYQEDNSLKYRVLGDETIQCFEFDLREQTFQGLRLDPLNHHCGISIEELSIITHDHRSVSLIDQMDIKSAFLFHGIYYFNHDDPQILFPSLLVDDETRIEKLIIRLRYSFVSKHTIAMNRYEYDAEQLHHSYHTLSSENQSLINKCNQYEDRHQELQSINQAFELSNELRLQTIQMLQEKLDTIYRSKSWRITAPMRRLISLFRAMVQGR